MAERVRAVMEAMAPDLEDLKRRGLCSHEEVRQLVKRRERAEYLIHRCTLPNAPHSAHRIWLTARGRPRTGHSQHERTFSSACSSR